MWESRFVEVKGRLSLNFPVVEVEGSCDSFCHAQLQSPG